MRNLNLSYNQLNYNEKSPHFKKSLKFLVELKEFFSAAIYINHINFSGMNFGKAQIMELL